ncbi:hypothetical protein [Kitasatospora sp. NPDC088783]|uniref:hypothetical protein n=1 Tax=Kitasatospora sp. NPDC088783 TaxID=3364077 RepID=UPI0037FB483E
MAFPVFTPSDFDDDGPCEDCGAPAGAYCTPGCGSGYSAHDAQRHAQLHAAGARRTDDQENRR